MPEQQSEELWRRRASSFGGVASQYAEHRPDYAAAAISWVLDAASGAITRAVDLGAGTGPLTAGLLAAGCRVTALEPDVRMLAELHRRHPDASAVVGAAEAIPLADGVADAVLVGTAFHWFDRERALAEIARVLRPGGVLGVLSNRDDDSVPWVAELGRVSRTSASSTPTEDERRRRTSGHPAFDEFERQTFAHRQPRTAASLTETVGTHSHTRVVSAHERAETLARVRAFLDARPETGRGPFDLPLVTRATRARRRDVLDG